MNRETNAWPKEETKDFGKNIKEVASNTFDTVKENASKYYQQGVEKAKELESDFEGKIKQYPLKSLLIAAGVGAIIGMIVKRR